MPTSTQLDNEVTIYCTSDNVKEWLPDAIKVEDGGTPNVLDPSPSSLTIADIERYIVRADSEINGKLSGVYDIPLKQVNMGGVVKFPDPIPLISARMTAMLIWQERLTGEQRQDTEWVRDNFNRAENELKEIVTGRQRLMGQDSFRASRFSKSDWHNIPPYPTRHLPDRAGR